MARMAALVALLFVSTCAGATVEVEGVTFTDEQYRKSLDVARYASEETLRYTYRIRKDTARNIVSARANWFRDLESVAAVYGVGPHVLGLLRWKSSDECPVVAATPDEVDRLTPEEQTQVLESLDMICGDTFCGGDLNYHVKSLACPVRSTTCTLTIKATPYHNEAAAKTYRCLLRGVDGFRTKAEIYDADSQGYTNELYTSVVTDCAAPIGKGTLYPVADRLTGVESAQLLASLQTEINAGQRPFAYTFEHVSCPESTERCHFEMVAGKDNYKCVAFAPTKADLIDAATGGHTPGLLKWVVRCADNIDVKRLTPVEDKVPAALRQQAVAGLVEVCGTGELCSEEYVYSFGRLSCPVGESTCELDVVQRESASKVETRFLCTLKGLVDMEHVLDTAVLHRAVDIDCIEPLETDGAWPGPNLMATTAPPTPPPTAADLIDENILQTANVAGFDGLVYLAGLSRTKTKLLFRYRPWCSMSELEEKLRPSDLAKLHAFITREKGLCFKSGLNAPNCNATSQCAGVPFDGVVPFGKCVPRDNVPDDKCSIIAPCRTGICAGLSSAPLSGICRPTWMGGRYAGLTLATAEEGTVLIPVYGQASVPTDVVLSLYTRDMLSHPDNITISVVDPPGTHVVTVFDGPEQKRERGYARLSSQIVVPHPADDTINGGWRVVVRGGFAGSITAALVVTSRWD